MSKGCFCGISNFTMETSQATREAILQLHNEGYSDSEIGRRLGIHRSTVARWIRRQAELGNTDNRHRRGRPRCTTPEDDQAIAAVITAHAPFTPDASNIRDTLGLQCTPQTVRNRHHSEGLRGRIPATKPVLSEANMESRLEYADKPHHFWENVIFCDEKTFCSDGPPANKHVWRHPNTRYETQHVVGSRRSGRARQCRTIWLDPSMVLVSVSWWMSGLAS
ncbi:uncharacterized protein [Panulirus ornatus]|uniref:uncharacterized protein n=1 Tax=Panulirus ornatus TaxID=150431 RepID=UPI003A89C64E